MSFRFSMTAAALVATLAVAGCGRSGTNTTTYKTGADGQATNVITDGGLDKVARIVGANAFRRGDTLQAQVEVENTTGRPQSFVSRWVWYEGDYEVKGLANDRVRTIKPREVMVINGTAPNPDVDGWQLRLTRTN